MARLVIETVGEKREQPLAASLIIGRRPASGLSLEDPKLSREHVRIDVERGPQGVRYTLSDLNSTNGTLLNGQPIRGTHPIPDGAEIRIGSTTIRFHLDAGETPAAIVSPTAKLTRRTRRHAAPVAPKRGLVFAFVMLILFAATAYGSHIGFTKLYHRYIHGV